MEDSCFLTVATVAGSTRFTGWIVWFWEGPFVFLTLVPGAGLKALRKKPAVGAGCEMVMLDLVV